MRWTLLGGGPLATPDGVTDVMLNSVPAGLGIGRSEPLVVGRLGLRLSGLGAFGRPVPAPAAASPAPAAPPRTAAAPSGVGVLTRRGAGT